MKILLTAGARPNFMKIAPIVRRLKLKAQSSKLERGGQELKAKSNPQISQISQIEYKIGMGDVATKLRYAEPG